MRETDSSAGWWSDRLKILWGVYWLALFCVMHIPKQRLPGVSIPYLDTAVHLSGYAVLALLGAAVAVRSNVLLSRRWYVTWLMVYAAYAAGDELLQPYVNRTADVFDWLADVGGVLIGFGIAWMKVGRGSS